ncbi:hypothetical protein CCY99_08935 [Helicobacter sp. 16-1353]|uniref:hypothetical protein n=1 Tax=Helicobacter sp. 16-1353 TaxID=2004996 RepID=UPI000DCBE150|nr:hypothetical protein [Helicobacter sp. 16-1353]RAX51487.1 hypothetical protein CCY99_08935 [Helicobacter sp. 16-1353]
MDKNVIEAEFLACVGLCVNDWNYGNKDALTLNTDNIALLSFLNTFPNLHTHHIKKNDISPLLPLENVKMYSKAIELRDSDFNLIIDLDNKTTDFFNKLLRPNGILIINLLHLEQDLQGAKKQIDDADFKIKMPFKVENSYYLFLSNSIHPLADICLQKIDMLEDLTYYNAKMHEAAFALPNYLKDYLKGVVRN